MLAVETRLGPGDLQQVGGLLTRRTGKEKGNPNFVVGKKRYAH